MKTNKLIISIKKPRHEVFAFTVTPPNSIYWIPDLVNEETDELPIKKGTKYKLQTKRGETIEIQVDDFKQDEIIEWISLDKNYHCKYTYISTEENICQLEYFEWVDKGEIDEPFSLKVLEKLKSVLETL